MVVGYNVLHIFKFPVDVVVKTYINEINNNLNAHNVTDIQQNRDDSADMDCLNWVVTWENCFPSFFQRVPVLQKKTIKFYEEIWSQWKEKRHWLRRSNLTWKEDSDIGRVVYVTQHERNENWTYWEETGIINFASFGNFSYALEMYLKRKLKSRSYEEIRILENVLLKSN